MLEELGEDVLRFEGIYSDAYVMRTIASLHERCVIGLPQFEEVPSEGTWPLYVGQYMLQK